MEIKLRKLDSETTGPNEFAVSSEQELMEYGYVWDYTVFHGGLAVRTGYSNLKTESEVRAFIVSGLSRMEWEAMHS